MRATVTTPSGERFEGVTGDLLTYYLGEAEVTPGYQVVEEPEEAAAFPQVWQDGVRVDQPAEEKPQPSVDVITDGTGAVLREVTVTDPPADPDPADAPPA